MARMGTVDTTEVAVDHGVAWAWLEDVTRNPRWQSGMTGCAWTSPPPVGVGSTYEQQARFLGRRIVSSFVVTDHDPGRSITITSTAGTFPITVTRTVEDLGPGRCRIVREVTGEPGGVTGLLAPLVRPRFEASVAADGRRLAALLEGGPADG